MILLRIILALWKPIAAFLGALGLYGRGRADANAKARLKASEQALQQHKDRENVESDIRIVDARSELRNIWRR